MLFAFVGANRICKEVGQGVAIPKALYAKELLFFYRFGKIATFVQYVAVIFGVG